MDTVETRRPPGEAPLARAEQLLYLWETRRSPSRTLQAESRRRGSLQERFAGQWCGAVWTEPHYGRVEVSDLCPGGGVHFGAANLTTGADFPSVDPATTEQQLERMREHLDKYHPPPPKWVEALEGLQRLSELKAQDIFAFRETWTDLDTELLRGLDGGADAFVPGGELTTEAFSARLPSIEEWRQVINGGVGNQRRRRKERNSKQGGGNLTGLAIVGGAGSLTGKGFGQEIDSHAQVVRFNEIVGSRLVPEETGIRTSVHVMCSKVAPLQDPAVLEIDLETDCAWRSYCGRMHSRGEFANVTDKVLLIRPSAHCVLSAGEAVWTRGFLFYWFIGRLFSSVDLYGFNGTGHYNNSLPIYEKWLEFEHLFYRVNQLDRH